MTLEQTGAIMDVLQVAYPQYYKNVPDAERLSAARLWAGMFADDPVEIVVAAVKAFIATDTKGFPPVIGQIKSYVVKATTAPEKSELEAWSEVKKALSNSGYHAAEEFAKLDPVIQRIVGAPSQLREWAAVDLDVLDSVIGSNFQRSYRAISKNERERAALPSAVRDIVYKLADSKALNAVDDEPKSLPISVAAEVDRAKQAISLAAGGKGTMDIIKNMMSSEEFERRRADILAALEEVANDDSGKELSDGVMEA